MTIKIRLIILAVNLTFYIIFTAPSVFAEDGDIIWTFTPVGSSISYPAIDTNGTIYVGVTKGSMLSRYYYYVYAVNPDGTQKWVSPSMPGTGSESLTIPQPAIGDDGTIYVGTPGHKLYAYNTDDTLKWVYDFLANDKIYASIESALAIANDGTIYVGVWANNDLYLYAINPDGTKKWSYDVGHYWGGEMGSPVVAADGTIYVVADPTRLLAINPDGTAKMSLSGNFNFNIAIGDNETIYVISAYCELIAVNQNGSIKWTFDPPSDGTCNHEEDDPPPVIGTDGTIYVSLNELYAIYPNGIKKWSQPMGRPGHIIGADGNIYIGKSVINPDGTLIRTLSNGVFNPALGVDGTLYGAIRGLAAIETSSNGPASSAWPMFQHNLKRTGNTIDNTPPSIIATIPLDEDMSVPLNVTVTATFSEDIDPTTIDEMTFTVSGPDGPVAGIVKYDTYTSSATFSPSSALIPDTKYLANITTAVTDTVGNNMVSPHSWSFSTLLVKDFESKLLPLDGAIDDYFGDVSISGNFAIVSASGDDDNGSNSGSAYIFERSGSSWGQTAKLTASDGIAEDYFGRNVSISGGYAIVGAMYDDDNGSNSGSAYIFERNGTSWDQVAKLTASDGTARDYFGSSVSISGGYAIAGAYADDDNGWYSGSAYIFERNGTSWDQVAKLTASDGAVDDVFGSRVSISGGYAIVGAYRDDDNGSMSGSAYIFERNGSSWNQVAKLTSSDGAAEHVFGSSVSISGGYAIVGATGDDDNGSNSGSAYIFHLSISNNISSSVAMPWIPLLLLDD